MEENNSKSKFLPKLFANLSIKNSITKSEIDNMSRELFNTKDEIEEDITK